MASNNSYSIEGWADRMTAHFQTHFQRVNIAKAEIEKAMYPRQPLIVSQQVIDFLKQYEKQQSKAKHMAEIKSAGNNYNL